MTFPLVNLGENFSAGNDAISTAFGLSNAFSKYSESPVTDNLSTLGAMLSLASYTFSKIFTDAIDARGLVTNTNAASGYFSMLGRAGGMLQFTSEAVNLDNAIKSGNVDQQVQAGLGMIAGLGGVISNIPTPATRALGIGMQVLGTIGKEGIKKRLVSRLRNDVERFERRFGRDVESLIERY